LSAKGFVMNRKHILFKEGNAAGPAHRQHRGRRLALEESH
jgi:hypothetical protein